MKTKSIFYSVILTGLLFSFFINCSKETPKVTPPETVQIVPTVTTLSSSSITSTSFSSGGNINSDGGTTVTARGVCWSTSQNPTVASSKTSDGTGTGTFASLVSGLSPGTTYYTKAYATNSVGTGYGSQIIVTTTTNPQLPSITTTGVTLITVSSASSGGNITSAGSSTVTAKGVCWSISEFPTISNSKTTDGTGTGNFNSSITGLSPNTTYYIRSYATNSDGTAYGSQITFTTSPSSTIPTLTTSDAALITSTSVNSGGNITSDGGSPITARGVCWANSPSPTIANNKTSDGTGVGAFSSNITGLSPGTTYYIRAYSTNIAGTTYGNQISFTTSLTVQPAVITTNSITSITNATATSGGNITSDGGSPITARGVCWDISSPTTSSNKTSDGTGTGAFSSSIIGLLSGKTYYVRAYVTNIAGTTYGNQIAFTTTVNFQLPTISTSLITSLTSSSAISGGIISSQGGSSITVRGVCWSSSLYPTIANNKTSDGTGIGSFSSTITSLSPITTYYVRAYATNSFGTIYGDQITFTTSPNSLLPTISTTPATSITSSTALTGGTISNFGSGSILALGVCWSTSSNPTISGSKTTSSFTNMSFASSIMGLTSGTTYYIRAYVTNNYGTSYGNQITMTTNQVYNGAVTDIDGNTYNTVKIGTQVWIAENLQTTKYSDGTIIPLGSDNNSIWKNLTTPAYCWFSNGISNDYRAYGVLYNWFTVNTGKLCPTGWHIPSDSEWNILTYYLGGYEVAGDKLKEKGTSHWDLQNITASNETGFSAIGSGMRVNLGYTSLGSSAAFWSSTQDQTLSSRAYGRLLMSGRSEIILNLDSKINGYSVRCVKN